VVHGGDGEPIELHHPPQSPFTPRIICAGWWKEKCQTLVDGYRLNYRTSLLKFQVSTLRLLIDLS
jgi:hypothetical protein